MCTPIDANFTSVAEAKTYLTTQKPCGDIKGKATSSHRSLPKIT